MKNLAITPEQVDEFFSSELAECECQKDCGYECWGSKFEAYLAK